MSESEHPIDPAVVALRAAIPPGVHFGTSSWNYPGWKGLVYQRDYPATGAVADMLGEYARYPLFSTVGIDASFYTPLTAKTLESYAAVLPPEFRCVSKVWDRITVHTFAKARDKKKAGEVNPDFLNADLFTEAVLRPCQDHFARNTGPFVLEFQTIAKQDKIGPDDFTRRLDEFFAKVPREAQYGVEIRNAEFLTPAYFAVLREHDVAHVFNSWTRMPSIGLQLDLPGSVPASFIVARVLLRPGRYYAEAVDAFAPYDEIKDPNPELRNDIVKLVKTAEKLRIPAYILVNNRAEGSAPKTIAAVAALLANSQ